MLFRRAFSTTKALRSDLIQQAFISKVKELQSIGSELANKDPNVKKALQEELNRVAQKYQLGADSVSRLGVSFKDPKVESSFTAAYESVTIQQLLDQVKKDEKSFLSQKAARQAEEAKRNASINVKN
ncbi:unnamed protein product, partial [Mesorhabditis belari]|uniref:ATP synthase-coupling factor 6, mitochondrial n=1 Tax=Mesorhabditis belari TaxID=2138241 RepID=A0AAF3F066_9BILA